MQVAIWKTGKTMPFRFWKGQLTSVLYFQNEKKSILFIFTKLYIYIYIYIYIYECVCVRERERERSRHTDSSVSLYSLSPLSLSLSLSLSLFIRSYNSLLMTGLLDCIRCPHRDDGLCWSPSTGVSMWKSPLENILTLSALPLMSCLSYLNGLRWEAGNHTTLLLWSSASRICTYLAIVYVFQLASL